MKHVGRCFIMVAVCISFFLGQAQARDLKASLPILPPLVESKDKGILVDLVKAMAEKYKGGKITWNVYPFARSIKNVEKGLADFHMPLLVNPLSSSDKLPFQLSSDIIFKVQFVLYTNKNNSRINPSNLSTFNIETDQGHVEFFDFKVSGSPSIESSLRKVDMGRIDGWIFAMPESDGALKNAGFKNIKRWKYKSFDVRIVLQKGKEGKETDKILSGIIGKLKASGKYQKIMGPILDQKFED